MSIPPDEAYDVTQNEALVDAVADYLSALIRLGGGKLDTRLPPLPDMALETFLTITEQLVHRLGQLHAMARSEGLKLQLLQEEEEDNETEDEDDAEKADVRDDKEEADRQDIGEAKATEEKPAKRFPYPQTSSYEGGIEPPAITMAGVALDDPIFSKGKGGKGPFEVTVSFISEEQENEADAMAEPPENSEPPEMTEAPAEGKEGQKWVDVLRVREASSNGMTAPGKENCSLVITRRGSASAATSMVRPSGRSRRS